MRGRVRPQCFAALCACCVYAGAMPQSAKFEAQRVPAGTVRISGDRYMASIVRAWEEHFRRYHPEVQFETRLMGSDTAMSGLYNNTADVALLGRESNGTESDGFLHTLQYKPVELRLMTGSLDGPGMSYAPVLFVHKGNPLDKLTLAQVEHAFGCGQMGAEAPARTWGDLGATGEWKDKPLHLYSLDMESGTGIFFLRALQGDSKKMNWEIIREYGEGHHPDGTDYDATEQTMDALVHDPYGLAVSNLHYAGADVKALALAKDKGARYVQATRETLMDGSYPLARMTYAFVNQAPGMPLDPRVKEFLRFVYSEEGQRVVSDSGEFLPVQKDDAVRQMEKLR
jgi:phosphate transport system substrate-binding protein